MPKQQNQPPSIARSFVVIVLFSYLSYAIDPQSETLEYLQIFCMFIAGVTLLNLFIQLTRIRSEILKKRRSDWMKILQNVAVHCNPLMKLFEPPFVFCQTRRDYGIQRN